MNSLCLAVMRRLEAGTPLVLVTLMDQSGSAPRTAGARMLVLPDGNIVGTVGGGRYEAEAVAVAMELHRQGGLLPCGAAVRPGVILEYSLRGVTDMDMICGGALALLLEYLPSDTAGALAAGSGASPTFAAAARDGGEESSSVSAPSAVRSDGVGAACRPEASPVQAVFAVGREAETAGAPFVIITRLRRDSASPPLAERDYASPPLAERDTASPPLAERKEVSLSMTDREEAARICAERRHAVKVERFVWLPESGVLSPSGAGLPERVLAGAAALRSDAPCLCAHDGHEYLLELFPRPFRVVLFGAGHVSREVAALAHNVGFQITVVDDRAEFASPARFPNAALKTPPSLSRADCAALLARMRIRLSDAMVIITRGHAHDREALGAALETGAGYTGMIGSRSKRAAVYASLREAGFTEEQLRKVHSPIGLDIGAETPAEIAVSIVAELIRWRNEAREAARGSGGAA